MQKNVLYTKLLAIKTYKFVLLSQQFYTCIVWQNAIRRIQLKSNQKDKLTLDGKVETRIKRRCIKLLTRLHNKINIYSSGDAPVIRSPEPLTTHTHFPTSRQRVESERDVPLHYEGSQPAVGIDLEWYTS